MHTNDHPMTEEKKRLSGFPYSVRTIFFNVSFFFLLYKGKSHIHQLCNSIGSCKLHTLFSLDDLNSWFAALNRIFNRFSGTDKFSNLQTRVATTTIDARTAKQKWYRSVGLRNNRCAKLACAWKLRLLFRMNYRGTIKRFPGCWCFAFFHPLIPFWLVLLAPKTFSPFTLFVRHYSNRQFALNRWVHRNDECTNVCSLNFQHLNWNCITHKHTLGSLSISSTRMQ